MKILTTSLLLIFGIALGLATVLLLPFVFLVWYDAWWRRHEVDAHLSAAMPSPAEAVQCNGGDVERDETLSEDPLPPAFQRWMDGRK
jgi:hypothetical protein